MEDCHRLGILVHGTFIVGLPGETRDSIERTIEFAKTIDPYSLQVSLAAPYPGTALYHQAQENGWLPIEGGLVQDAGIQEAVLSYPSCRAPKCTLHWSASIAPTICARGRFCASCATWCATGR